MNSHLPGMCCAAKLHPSSVTLATLTARWYTSETSRTATPEQSSALLLKKWNQCLKAGYSPDISVVYIGSYTLRKYISNNQEFNSIQTQQHYIRTTISPHSKAQGENLPTPCFVKCSNISLVGESVHHMNFSSRKPPCHKPATFPGQCTLGETPLVHKAFHS